MKILSKLTLTLGSMILCFTAAYANDPTTFLGPTVKGGYTSTFNNNTAYSVLGEAGLKNFRAGGTVGWKLEQNQYIKVSAEYLVQDITYQFSTGNSDQWVQQGAIGGGYLYEFQGYCYAPQFDLNAYLSHAPSKSLNGTRRIAGSTAGGIVPALSVAPWQGARTGLGLNYDNVNYDKKYSPSQDAHGLGGTFTFNQVLTQDVDLHLGVGVRQPFNNYVAGLTFANVPYFGMWVVGLDGAYTAGKNTLPNTWNIGLSANYALDSRVAPVMKGQGNMKDTFKDTAIHDDLVKYTAAPAVYMPQVLAIAEEDICTGTTLTGVPIPSITVGGGDTATANAAPSFSPSSGLTYTITPNATLIGANALSINPTTGVITANGGGNEQIITATVTANNGCASASTTVTVEYTD